VKGEGLTNMQTSEKDIAASQTPLVVLESVRKLYHQGRMTVTAVDDFCLRIATGEFATLSGPSGSGKTTILNLIGALDVPTSGTVRLEGVDLTTLSRTELSHLRRDRIGFVFQAYNLVPVLTAYENAEFVLALQNVPPRERRERVMETLRAVGLADLAHRRPDELSGGQQQRVAIARAIVPRPAIVLADEPTANVDSATGAALLDLMEKLNRELRITFLFSTHDQHVMDRARRIIRLQDGRLVEDLRQEQGS
jgi:putative ABC transport system ATP-binding protein